MQNVLSYFKNGIKLTLTNDNSNVYKINIDKSVNISGAGHPSIPNPKGYVYFSSITIKSSNSSLTINENDIIELADISIIGKLPKKYKIKSLFYKYSNNTYYVSI